MTNDPKNPDYNAKARDAIMDLCPFFDPNHKCGIVREHVFKDCLAELRKRERLAMESACRMDALSSSGMTKILQLESERDAAYVKIRDCVARLDACADGYEDTRQAIADLAAILPENAESIPPRIETLKS